MKKISLLFFILVLCTALLLSACGGLTETQGSTAAETTAKLPDGSTSDSNNEENTPTLTPSEGLAYRINPEKEFVTITGIGTCTDTDIVVPETIEGYPVWRIGESAFSGGAIGSIVLPEGLEGIEQRAFEGCIYMTSVTLPESMTVIGYRAFADTGLREVTVPGGVTAVYEDAFCSCPYLRNVVIKEGVKILHDGAFRSCPNIETVLLPQSLTSVRENCFKDCEPTVTYNGSQESWALIEFDFGNFNTWPENVTFLNLPVGTDGTDGPDNTPDKPDEPDIPTKQTFYYRVLDENEKTCYISSIKDLGGSTDVVVPNRIDGYTVVYLMNGAFGTDQSMDSIAESITSVTVADTVTYLGDRVFAGCKKLKSVSIPNSVETIGTQAFADCAALTQITIPGSVKEIPKELFLNCANLSRITFEEGVETIGERAISGCPRLYEVKFPVSVTQFKRASVYNSSLLQGGKFVYNGSREQWEAITFGKDNWFSSGTNVTFKG